MDLKCTIAGINYRYRDPRKARVAAEAMIVTAARYQAKADENRLVAKMLLDGVDKALAEDEAKARAKKESGK